MTPRHSHLRLLVVTQQFPQGTGEAFLVPELSEIQAQVGALFVVPRSPGRTVVHGDAAVFLPNSYVRRLVSGEALGAAFRTVVLRPRIFVQVLRLLFRSRSAGVLFRNLGVLPKGLWLGVLAKDLQVDHIHSHWAATVSTMAMIASLVADVPWSLTTHRWDIVENNLLCEKSRSAQFVRFISRSGVKLAGGNLSEHAKVEVIHLGVPHRAAAEPRAVGQEFTLLCAANLIEVKGHRHLLEAMAQLLRDGVKSKLLIAGRGELREALERQVAALGIEESVHFLGVVPHEKLLEKYAGGEIAAVVLPSVDLGSGHHEGIPVSLMEAMSFGIPVVSTSTGGIPELLGDDSGLLVPPADSRALARALSKLAADPHMASEIGLRGRHRVMKEFSAEDGAAKLLDLIQPPVGTQPPVGGIT